MNKLLQYTFLLLIIGVEVKAQPCPDIIGYYPNWQWYDRAKLVNPMTIQYSKYNIINYSFFKPETSGAISSTDTWADENLLLGQINWSTSPVSYYPNTSIVQRAHNANTKVLPSIGGWTLSDNFPVIASNNTKRITFAHSCCDLIRTYNFDGIDIDWEYPGLVEHGGSVADKQNFTLLLQIIKDSLNALGIQQNKTYLLTACFGASKVSMQNIEWSYVKNIVDIINLMTYDYFGSWDATANHNSPLYKPLQGDATFNIDSSVTYLMDHYQVPANKIAAGVAFYGRSAKTTAAPALFAPITGTDNITFSEDDGSPTYFNIVKKQNLFTSLWDGNAQVPYLVGNGSLQTFVSYDDQESIGLKANYIKTKNLRGAIIWEITGDYLETSPGSGTIGSTPLIDTLKSVFCNGYGGGNNSTCIIPSSISTTSIMVNSANITWVSTSATSYNIEYKKQTDTAWTSTTSLTNSITLNTLICNTQYEVKIQSVCVSASSGFSTTYSFTTAYCNNNIPPMISVIAPTNNSSVTIGNITNVNINATDADGTISLVELYKNNVLIGSMATAPFNFILTNSIAGTFTIHAKAYDNNNASATSSIITYTVVASTTNTSCNYPIWNANTVYNNNDTVLHNDIIYQAKYWTQNNNPSTSYGNCCVWQYIMPCGGFTSATCFKPNYDSVIAYTTNQEVYLNGNTYRAKWWTLNENPTTNSGSGGVWLLLTTPCMVQLDVKAFIQGYYTGSNSLTSALQNQGMSTNALECDHLVVELHYTSAPHALAYICDGLLQTNGICSSLFPNTLIGNNYYVVLKHRNALETWSANPITMSEITNYDFTTAANKAYGDNQREVESGVWAFYSGDLNADENIDLLDLAIVETDILNFQFGYFATDINGDGNVDLLDAPTVESNINGFIFSNHP